MKVMLLMLMILSSNVFAKDILLNSNNTVTLTGPVNSSSVGDVISNLSQLAAIGDSTNPIYLVLNTPGGSVMAGLELMQYMNTLRRPVHVIANFAASMGFHILQTSSVRYITKYGTIMSHRASGGFQGDIPQQITSRLAHIIDLITRMDEQVVSRTKGKYTLKQYTELIRDEYWSVGSTAVKDKFADVVVEMKCDSSLEGYTSQTISSMFFSGTVKFAKCPLITTPVVDDAKDLINIKTYLNSYQKLEF